MTDWVQYEKLQRDSGLLWLHDIRAKRYLKVKKKVNLKFCSFVLFSVPPHLKLRGFMETCRGALVTVVSKKSRYCMSKDTSESGGENAINYTLCAGKAPSHLPLWEAGWINTTTPNPKAAGKAALFSSSGISKNQTISHSTSITVCHRSAPKWMRQQHTYSNPTQVWVKTFPPYLSTNRNFPTAQT